ncbi:FecR family protein [Sphingobacterium luzhongxinii]|uniref:FecR family protein n=1 Tax=Sphingobacterium luzhongxinii TaxID=2654181 RepID=UPI0013DC9D3E|nr:FecR domain-containing protein [Sphingobacterium sp. xlx-73]
MQEEKFRILLEKYIAGNCTEDEIAWLENAYLKWNEADKIRLTTQQLEAAQSFMWLAVQRETSGPEQSSSFHRSNKSGRSTWRRIAAAAVVLLSVSVGLYFYFIHKPVESTDYLLVKNSIQPGGNRAILTLDDGRTINLSNQKEGIVVGTDQINYSDGSPVYPKDFLSDKEKPMAMLILSTPNGGQYQITLPDGTKVWLNAGTTLKYPSRFIHNERRVELDGEAYFEVAKNTEQVFVVTSHNQEVRVLGTHFNINAYRDEESIKTTLLEGSIRVQSERVNSSTILQPGQQSITRGGNIKTVKVDPENAVDWKNGDFIFREDLQSALRRVARWYNVEIVYEPSAPKDLKFGGWVSRDNDIAAVLKLIESTGKVHFKIEKPLKGSTERRVVVSK